MRDVSGVLFIDKESGISSAFLLRQVKYLFRAKKAGHTGTLDPLATGMLPICLGEATKFSQFLLKSDKFYRVIAKLGERTDTFDSLGHVVCVRPVEFNETYLNCILNTFIGEIYQVPPMFSALKHCGFPLYRYARQGINVIRNSRLINIYKVNLVRFDVKYVELDVFCSTGTYIRSFVDDLGEALGCGAHVVSLRRLSVGRFSSKLMVDISTLKKFIGDVKDVRYLEYLDSFLYSVDFLVQDFPEINISLQDSYLLKFGQKIKIDKDINFFRKDNKSGLVRITVGHRRHFLGIGNVVEKKYLLVYRLISCRGRRE